jgi:acetyltransferase
MRLLDWLMPNLAPAQAGAATEHWQVGGEEVQIRPLRSDDESRVAGLVRELSARSRFRRFHLTMNEAPRALLARLLEVDPQREYALLATVRRGGVEIAVGEARYAAVSFKPGLREFALVVGDRIQRAGLGTLLMHRLMRHATWRGVEAMFGDVLRENTPMLALAQRLGFTPTFHPTDARLVRVEKTLPDFS